ncbi:MAG TPA: hypothetical protein VM285_17200 [Polyangia bacterium]|nr:hypothetical protein [Polyangia bacterium]
MKRFRLGAMAGVVVLLVGLGSAWANDGTPSWVHELMQDGSNVEVTLAIVENGEPGLPDAFTVTRDGPEGTATVVEDEEFQLGDEMGSEGQCRGSVDPEYCVDHAEECLDCDEDGVLECNTYGDGWCDTILFFELTDWCVPPGETTYRLTAEGWEWSDDEMEITVEEWDGECTPPGADDGGGGGCSVSGAGLGAEAPESLSLLLLALASAFLSLRRSHR